MPRLLSYQSLHGFAQSGSSHGHPTKSQPAYTGRSPMNNIARVDTG